MDSAQTLVDKCVSIGLFQEDSDPPISESLSIENTLWAGTVIASGKGALVEECVSNLKRKENPFV